MRKPFDPLYPMEGLTKNKQFVCYLADANAAIEQGKAEYVGLAKTCGVLIVERDHLKSDLATAKARLIELGDF